MVSQDTTTTTTTPKLNLSLGFNSDKPKNIMQFGCQRQSIKPHPKSHKDNCPSLTLSLPSENDHTHQETYTKHELSLKNHEENLLLFSNNSGCVVKRERDVSYDQIDEADEHPPNDGDDHHKKATRKKLRLTKEQSTILESSFRVHSTLSQNQKQELAEMLMLRPRQVEVWFQNRRARTKLKQTEVDCELLKKCCETLTIENQKLYKELQELKAANKLLPHHNNQAMYMQLLPSATATATLSLCSSCEKTAAVYLKAPMTTISFAVSERPPTLQ